MSNEATIPFQLKPGQRYAESGESGVVIHVGGTASGKVYLTPQQAIALKAGGPESIFEPLQSQQGSQEGQEGEGGQEGLQAGQEGLQAAPQSPSTAQSFDPKAEATTQAQDAEVSAFLSKPAKEITSTLEGVHDAQFISLLHSKETSAPKPRQAVIDALNTRYDAVMAQEKK